MSGQSIGIDYGDWKTCMYASSGKRFDIFCDGNNSESNHFFQSVVHYEGNRRNILVSSQALWSRDSHRVSRSHDYLTSDHVTSRRELEAIEQCFFTGLLARCDNHLRVTITYPVEFTEEQISRLRRTIESVKSVDNVNLIPDPIAAAFCYMKDKRLSWESFIGQYIVVDIGYTSTRISLVECERLSARVVSKEIIRGLSGEEISDQLIHLICGNKQREDVDELRRAIEVKGWGSMSFDDHVSFLYEDKNHEPELIEWNLSDLDLYLKSSICHHCFPVVDQLLNRNGKKILLVGGGSLLPSVKKLFDEKYPNLVYLKDYDPIASLAYGACRYRTCLPLP